MHQLQQALANGAKLIDVRELNEFEDAHVAGATHVALATVSERLDEFLGVEAAYLICRSGARSRRACEFLADEGIAAVNVVGGMVAWIGEGWPVVSEK